MTVEQTATVHAHAKINVQLRVGRRRADGYHELVSVIQTLDLADTLTIGVTPSAMTMVSVEAAGVPGGDTLVTRGIEALLEHADTRALVRVRIDKQIPVGGGLGGGSADAAAALVCVRDLLGIELRHDAWIALLASIGSDVPALASPTGAALVQGRGEQVEWIDALPVREVALLWPGTPTATAAVYGAYRPPDNAMPSAETVLAQARAGQFGNDLQHAACVVNDDVARALDRLAAAGDETLLCGSGSTIAVLADGWDPARAQSVADAAGCELIARARTR